MQRCGVCILNQLKLTPANKKQQSISSCVPFSIHLEGPPPRVSSQPGENEKIECRSESLSPRALFCIAAPAASKAVSLSYGYAAAAYIACFALDSLYSRRRILSNLNLATPPVCSHSVHYYPRRVRKVKPLS